jgi:gamma-glutamylcyclotransferase (GGCT)/AIG2-like uncharacterized protein YtfP
MPSQWVFVYGTLQVEAVLLQVLGRVPALCPASVQGFSRFRFRDASYPGAISDPAGKITGMLLGPLSAAELASLHAYEGERYECVHCAVYCPEPVAARIYTVLPAFQPLLTVSEWDLEHWLVQDSAAFLASL